MERHWLWTLTIGVVACGGPPPETPSTPEAPAASTTASSPAAAEAPGATGPKAASADEFQMKDTGTGAKKKKEAYKDSKIQATSSEAAVRLFIVDRAKEDQPIPGIVISLTGKKDGKTFYTAETDKNGFAEVLVPNGQTYDIVYLSLGRRDMTASLDVTDEPRQNLKLTLRYKRFVAEVKPPPTPDGKPRKPGIVLDGINFQTAKATILAESFPRLDRVVEYMTHKKSAKILVSGHTDNVGKPATNKQLSERRAQACKDYLVQKGIDPSRIQVAGFGDEQPVASNDTEEGRQQNRRIEATELVED